MRVARSHRYLLSPYSACTLYQRTMANADVHFVAALHGMQATQCSLCSGCIGRRLLADPQVSMHMLILGASYE